MVEEKKFLMGPKLLKIDDYDFNGLKNALEISPEELVNEIKKSGLKGRGGAGFPTGLKWEFAQAESGDKKYMICNADEGEPGTFKDRYLLEERPLKVLEGLLIAARAVGADEGFIYIRGEYTKSIKIFKKLIKEAEESGLLGSNIFDSDFSFELTLVRGAGAYVCGDETALINSIEGERGISRITPPYPIQSGLFGKPTVVNNVESLATAAEIMNQGADYYSNLGTEESSGTKLICFSGDIQKPGVYEVEFGSSTLRELVYDLGGGPLKGEEIKFIIPGGLSTSALAVDELDHPYSYEGLEAAGSSIGSGAIIVVSKNRNLINILQLAGRFYMEETCGTCTPCREGNRHVAHILSKCKDCKFEKEELEIIDDICLAASKAARCGLGQTSLSLARSLLNKFSDELVIGGGQR